MLPSWNSKKIVSLRPTFSRPTPGVEPMSVLREQEAADPQGGVADVLTVFLLGSECTFRCLMCDLWKYTHLERTASGAIAQQVVAALCDTAGGLPAGDSSEGGVANREKSLAANWIKLYNASNFFAPVNVPVADLPQIAAAVANFERVIVENHPRMLVDAISTFRSELSGRLEIAMGLETVHAATLERLNKQMTADDFRRACDWLRDRDVDVRAFVLLRPPGMSAEEGVDWCLRSADFARAAGARHISIIPLRGGNGALEKLAEQQQFAPPSATDVALVMQQLLGWNDVVVTADMWDWERLPASDETQRQQLRVQIDSANRTQHWPTM